LANLEIKLTRSKIGRKQDQIATVEALGLRKIGQTVIKVDTPQIRGMIKKVYFMLDVKEV